MILSCMNIISSDPFIYFSYQLLYKASGTDMKVTNINEDYLSRNNLDKSSSPYLVQHASNPVWWQEWSGELISYAATTEKLLFVSVGYASCHWCHVMAAEAFSDSATASFLNTHFICIKVDRESRPDIDQFLMDFINNQNGRGGWPLNVFMTSDLKPVYAFTYAPVHSGDSIYSLLSIAENVDDFYLKNKNRIPSFTPVYNVSEFTEESVIGKTLSGYYDPENGGFGISQKFPPHSSLLYLLFQPDIRDSPSVLTICMKTLDAMQRRGLNDHLQGGIFRYCIDKEWTIPHFEKMLYDQAMSLWCYSLAYRVTGKQAYKLMAEKILECLHDSFLIDGFYKTALDADTEHEEGATYLWSYEQLNEILNHDELERFARAYYIFESGNFGGLIHLLRRNDEDVTDIEKKLLSVRRKRKQPASDDKILSGLNSLLAISIIQAGRFLDQPQLENQAGSLVRNILDKFWNGTSLRHSYYKGTFQELNFLFDAGALLTAVTMLFENDNSWESVMNDLSLYVETFRDAGRWKESSAADFRTVYASLTDHPSPSSISLAEMGLARAHLLTGNQVKAKNYKEPFISDFYNIAVMYTRGLFHVIESSRQLSWNILPVNSLRATGIHETDCFMGTCTPIDNEYFTLKI
jgi:uncharacterized protein